MSDDPLDPTELSQTQTSGSADNDAGASIGPYRLLQKIGEGGMGEVWLAEQDRPVRRQVALKIIKRGLDSREVVARFEAERQALAMMDHPSVAKVFEAGTTPRGRPFFVMEYVKGLSITESCDRHQLTTRERLLLFRDVCDGVHHAHQKAIIHRDLKPSNVMVTELDGRRVPKIIDFGVAKATTQKLTEKTMFTAFGALIGTPDYMSPEQAELTGEDVDTRADVYSLGVILYELLVGTLPFDPKELRSGGFEGIRRKILEEQPLRPSERVTTLGDAATNSAKARRTEPSTLQRQLSGDLDWITMKAMEKDRARRYASANEFARDLDRYLADEPVVARPPSVGYRVGKFVRRHRLGVAAATLLTLAILAGAAGTTVGLLRAREAENQAIRESETSQRTATFLAEMLKGIDPQRMGNGLRRDLASRMDNDDALDSVNLVDVAQGLVDREILSHAGEMIDRDLQDDPAMAAELHRTIGEVYQRGLELYPPAVESFRKALTLAETAEGADSPLAMNAKFSLAWGLLRLGTRPDREEAKVLFEEFLDVEGPRLGWEDPQILNLRMSLADTRRMLGDRETAEQELRELIPLMRREMEDGDAIVYLAINDLALTIDPDETKMDEAETLFRESIEGLTRIIGPDDFETLNVRRNLARLLLRMGRDDTVPYLEALVEHSERALGLESPLTIGLLGMLASRLHTEGRDEEALQVCRRGLEAARPLRTVDPSMANATVNLNWRMVMAGELDESEALLLEFERELKTRQYPRMNVFRQYALYNLGSIAALRGNRTRGLDYLGQAVDAGWSRADAMLGDESVSALHGNEFDRLVERTRANASAGN